MSALKGDNVFRVSKNMPWYHKIQIPLYIGIWLVAVIGPWYALPYLDWASKFTKYFPIKEILA